MTTRVRVRLGVKDLDDIADGDLAEDATFGGHDRRGEIQRPGASLWRGGGIGVGVAGEAGEAVGVTTRAQHPNQGAVPGRARQQPGQRRAHNIGGDRHPQRDGHEIVLPSLMAATLG